MLCPPTFLSGDRLKLQLSLHLELSNPPLIGDLLWLVLLTDLLARYFLLLFKISIALTLPVSTRRCPLPHPTPHPPSPEWRSPIHSHSSDRHSLHSPPYMLALLHTHVCARRALIYANHDAYQAPPCLLSDRVSGNVLSHNATCAGLACMAGQRIRTPLARSSLADLPDFQTGGNLQHGLSRYPTLHYRCRQPLPTHIPRHIVCALSSSCCKPPFAGACRTAALGSADVPIRLAAAGMGSKPRKRTRHLLARATITHPNLPGYACAFQVLVGRHASTEEVLEVGDDVCSICQVRFATICHLPLRYPPLVCYAYPMHHLFHQPH